METFATFRALPPHQGDVDIPYKSRPYEIAQRLAVDGMAVVLSDVDARQLAATRKQFDDAGYAVETFKGDVSRPEDQQALVAKAVKAFGCLDVFVNNAGIEQVKPLDEVGPDDLDKIFRINVNGVL